MDTAYLYQVEGETPDRCPSLRDVLGHVMQSKLADTHNPVEDAQAALRAALYLCQHGSSAPITRSVSEASASLLVHRIPDTCTELHFYQLFVKQASVIPVGVNPITKSAVESGNSDATIPAGKTTVVFASAAHADLALDAIVGPNRPDNSNRMQKRVYLKGGGYVCVRKR